MQIGPAIDAVRRKRGLKQNELAKLAGISTVYLSYLINNKKEANPKTLKAIANALDVPLEILLILSLTEAGITDDKRSKLEEIMPLVRGLLDEYLRQD